MPKPEQPRIETMDASEAARDWSRILDTVSREKTRVIVEVNGEPAAALISSVDLERLGRWELEEAHRLEILERFREPFRNVSPAEIEREVAKAIAEVRADGPGDRGRPQP